MVLTLHLREESSVVLSRMRLSLREVFLPELEILLHGLNATGEVHFTHAFLPALLWETHIAFFDTVVMCVMVHAKNRPVLAGQLKDIINAERFLWERLLDAPFGNIGIVTLEEMLAVVTQAYERLQAKEETLV